MVRHRDMEGDFWRGRWIFPGGRVERGERLAEAAAREVLEETGLRIRVGHPIPPHDRVVRGEDGSVRIHVVYHVHWAFAEDERLTPGDDVADAAWFSAEDRPHMCILPLRLPDVRRWSSGRYSRRPAKDQ